MSERGSLYWLTMEEQLTNKMRSAIEESNVDGVESVLRLQRAVCTRSAHQNYYMDWTEALVQVRK